MLFALLTTSLAVLYIWSAWHRDLALTPRLKPITIVSAILIPWLLCLMAWLDRTQFGTPSAVISTIAATLAMAAALVLAFRYRRHQEEPL